MAPSRQARSTAIQPLYADDTDGDSDTGTPKPHKSGTRKRLSEGYTLGGNDDSFFDGRVPLKSVNINDDAAEKRRRRKSAKVAVVENAVAGPSSAGNQDQDASESARAAKQKQHLHSVAPPPMATVPLDVMSSNFEEWMKMATDNKINAANSWNFALIDYFHDMSLLRNNDDNSINFQRASCTLDGCVKIWTSRVDSVGTETGKLLSNLASDGKDENSDNNSDVADGDVSQPKRKKNRSAATLAKDPSQLRTKKLELEFSVDPLFKKTCADFDEGGAQGLLMNHLCLGEGTDAGLRVIFDASDSNCRMEGEETINEAEEDIDLTYLRSHFLPHLDHLEHKAISHSLSRFSFGKDAFAFDDNAFSQENTVPGYEDDSDAGGDYGMGINQDDGAPVIEEDFFVGADAVHNDNGSNEDDDAGDVNSNVSIDAPKAENEILTGSFVPFDPRRLPNERDLVLAMADADAEGALDYFDQTFMKNWAGPEHWKLRKVIRRLDADVPALNKPSKTKSKKEVFKIDFTTPAHPTKDIKTLSKEVFAPVTKGMGINLPRFRIGKNARKKTKEKRDSHRLPDDMHFTSRQLVTLFLKPKFFLKMRGRRATLNDNGDGEVDETFWAQAAAEQAAERRDDDGNDDTNDDPIPFNTQFFHDDYDDSPGFDDGFEGDVTRIACVEASEEDLLAVTQGQTRRVRPEFINYAKRAKRVDVRKLKENIWRGLDIVVVDSTAGGQGDSMNVDETAGPVLTDPLESRQFSQVISGLQESYPREKMEEISTSFCFICLLHLANEQGLKLEPKNEPEFESAMGLDKEVEKKVGDIWDIKIYRDPNATQSA